MLTCVAPGNTVAGCRSVRISTLHPCGIDRGWAARIGLHPCTHAPSTLEHLKELVERNTPLLRLCKQPLGLSKISPDSVEATAGSAGEKDDAHNKAHIGAPTTASARPFGVTFTLQSRSPVNTTCASTRALCRKQDTASAAPRTDRRNSGVQAPMHSHSLAPPATAKG